MSISFKSATHNELIALVDKGNRAKECMMEGHFFKTVLVPALEEELANIERSLIWVPGSTESTVEKIALDRVWKSGVSLGIGKLWEVLNRVKNEGAEALKEMGLREKKKAL